ncbi:MAG: response regulator [Alphaproteobacteria bacterium]|nr:response regulator [Alphaproteobacteria bacterium]
MLVIVKNAERTLLQELKNCWEHFPAYRCLHLKSSQFNEGEEEWLDQVLETAKAVLDDKSAQFYLCRDKDVFVITRTTTQKTIDRFLAHLSPKLGPALQACIKPGLASLFEIGVDWPKLRALCERKIGELEYAARKQQQKTPETLDKVSAHETFKTLDRNLVDSLSSRREKRDTPEIMVVEDDLFSQKLVGNALKNKYSLSVTGDGRGAILNYVNKAPDVLFLDIGLPDINGHEVLAKLFELDPDAYVVMFSGNGDRENIMRAVELGAKGFVGKPFTQEKLLQYIQKSPFIQKKQSREHAHGNLVH